MEYTFLPVTHDGHLYERDDNILRYTPCIILSRKELVGLKSLHRCVSYLEPCPVFEEVLKYPIKIKRGYGASLKPGNYVLYLYEGLSPRSKALIHGSGGVMPSFVRDIICFQHVIEFLVDRPDSALYDDRFEKEIEMVEILFDACMPFYQMLGLI